MNDETTAVDDELLTVAEVARLLKTSRRYVYNQIASGALRGLDLASNTKRVRRSAVTTFLSEREAS